MCIRDSSKVVARRLGPGGAIGLGEHRVPIGTAGRAGRTRGGRVACNTRTPTVEGQVVSEAYIGCKGFRRLIHIAHDALDGPLVRRLSGAVLGRALSHATLQPIGYIAIRHKRLESPG